HLALVHASLGETGADPECLAPGRVRDVTSLATDVHVTVADPIQHWEDRPLTRNIDNRALVALPHDVRRSFTAHQQTVASDSLETHSNRHPLVGVRVVAGKSRILRQPGRAGAKQKVFGGRILESTRDQSRSDWD